MFRHERPQKGRYRQFHQIGVETFGIDGPDIDVELILITARLWKKLGLENVHLEINTLGSNEAREKYKTILVEYFGQHKDFLDEDSLRRLESNPLRILDSKNPAMQEMIEAAPKLMDCLDEESLLHFEILQAQLQAAGIAYRVNTRLVRGLDYYCKTVFEWVTDQLGAQGTVCAGGRYDSLVDQLGGKPTPAAGFAMGIERLISLLEDQGFEYNASLDIYIALQGDVAQQKGMLFSESLRNAMPELSIQVNCGGGSFKSQIKKADKSGAVMALILGEDEINQQTVTAKHLREKTDQVTVQQNDVHSLINEWLK